MLINLEKPPILPLPPPIPPIDTFNNLTNYQLLYENYLSSLILTSTYQHHSFKTSQQNHGYCIQFNYDNVLGSISAHNKQQGEGLNGSKHIKYVYNDDTNGYLSFNDISISSSFFFNVILIPLAIIIFAIILFSFIYFILKRCFCDGNKIPSVGGSGACKQYESSNLSSSLNRTRSLSTSSNCTLSTNSIKLITNQLNIPQMNATSTTVGATPIHQQQQQQQQSLTNHCDNNIYYYSEMVDSIIYNNHELEETTVNSEPNLTIIVDTQTRDTSMNHNKLTHNYCTFVNNSQQSISCSSDYDNVTTLRYNNTKRSTHKCLNYQLNKLDTSNKYNKMSTVK